MRNLVMVVLDSLRYDTAVAASTPNLDRLGPLQRRWSYATWTAPSHYNLLMGLLPHSSPPGVFANDYYRHDYARFSERLGYTPEGFADLAETLWLPSFLGQIGYSTHARVSMPVLSPASGINRGFDTYGTAWPANSLRAIVDDLDVASLPQPFFALLNTGETHYPYVVPGDPHDEMPVISGVHGTLRRLADDAPGAAFFDAETMTRLHGRQRRALEYCDAELGALFAVLSDDTWVIVLSDHGELFGEDGYFGHGPIAHDKVLEVPLWEGLVPR